MPLTPAHIAAAWPLSRILPRLPLDALILGTMTPDFEYLLQLAPRGRFGHSPLGLLVFCVPVGVLSWLVYRRVVRPAAATLLPAGVAAALPAREAGLPLVAAAILIGAASHALWDSFTHFNGWGVRQLPALRDGVSAAGDLPWYSILQHGSTLLGLSLLVLWVGRCFRRLLPTARRYHPVESRRARRIVASLISVAASGAVLNGLRGARGGPAWALGYGFVGGMAAAIVALVVFGLIVRHQAHQGVRPPTPSP